MSRLKQLYSENKLKKVGDKCICPSCSTPFIKGSYQQVFCKTKVGTYCKDQYWNKVDPKKRNNTTRISPASARWLLNHPDYDDDQGWDAHKNER